MGPKKHNTRAQDRSFDMFTRIEPLEKIINLTKRFVGVAIYSIVHTKYKILNMHTHMHTWGSLSQPGNDPLFPTALDALVIHTPHLEDTQMETRANKP